MNAFTSAVLLLDVVVIYVTFRPSKAGRGVVAIGFTLAAIWSALSGQPSAVTWIYAGVAAFWGWLWWKSGGDDDTRRRLREAARAFTPVRRTAPVTT